MHTFQCGEHVESISKYYAYKGVKPVKIIKDPIKVNFELKYTGDNLNIPLKMVTKLAEKYILQQFK